MAKKTIDEKVVSLEFDNSKFESNVKKTLSTLDKLKEKLKFNGATKGLDELDKASSKLSFSGMSSGIDNVSVKFDLLHVAGITALTNITNKLVDFGVQLVKSMSGFDLMQQGWNKMDQMTGSVQTLVNSTGRTVEDITGYLNKLMLYADETSFGFTDMTSALATMTASGGQIEKLIPMIEGIANATAYAGKGAAEFSRVIYNLNQSYSAGYLTYMDWKSVQLAGVNSKALMETLISSAEELGKIQKGSISLGNFTETLKNKWADTEVMEHAFNRFAVMTTEAHRLVESGQFDNFTEAYAAIGDQFDEIAVRAARSAQEATTFKQAIDATTEATQSKWLQVFTKIFGDYNQAKITWTQLANDTYELFAQPIQNLVDDVIGPAFTPKWDQFRDVLQGSGVDVQNLDDNFLTFIKSFNGFSNDVDTSQEQWAEYVDNLIEKYGGLKEVFSSGALDKKHLRTFLESIAESSEASISVVDKLETAQKLFDDIWSGKYGNGEARIKALTEAGYDYAGIQKTINDLALKGHKVGYKLTADDIANLSDEMLKNLNLTDEEIEKYKELREALDDINSPLNELINSLDKKSGQQLLSETIHNFMQTIINIKETIGKAWTDVFNPAGAANAIYSILEKINKFTERIANATKESSLFYNIMKSIFSIFKVITSVIKQLISGGLNILGNIFDKLNINIGDFSTKIGDALGNFATWISENNVIFNFLEGIGNKVGDLIDILNTWIDAFMQLPIVTGIINGFTTAVNGLTSGINKIQTGEITLGTVKKSFESLYEEIKDGSIDPMEAFSNGLGKYFSNIGEIVGTTKDKVVESFNIITGKLKVSEETSEKILGTLQRFIETGIGIGAGYMMLKGFQKLADGFSNLVAPLKSLSDVFKAFAGVGNNLSKLIQEYQNSLKINNIFKIAIAIGVLAGALYIMAKLDSKGLWDAILALGALCGIIAAFAFVMSNVPKMEIGLQNLSKFILALSGALLIMAVALRIIDSTEHIEKDLIAVIIMLAGLVAACKILSKNEKDLAITVGTLLGMSASILILAMALKSIGSISWDQLKKGLVGMAGAVAALILVSIAMRNFKTDPKSILTLMFFSASLYILANTMKKLADMNATTLAKGFLAMLPLFGAFVLVMLAVKSSGQASAAAVGYFLGLAMALRLLANVIEIYAKMDLATLLKGGIIVGALMGLLTTFATFVGLASKMFGTFRQMAAMGLMMVAMAASLYLMAGVILIFKNIALEDLMKSVAAISILLTSFGAMVALMQWTKFDFNSFKSITALAVVIAALAGAILVLSFIDSDKLLTTVTSMVSVMIVLGLLVSSLKFITKDTIASFLTGILGIIAILGSISAVFYILSSFGDTNKYEIIADSLTKVMLSLSLLVTALGIVSKITVGGAIISTAAKVLAVVGVISAILLAIGSLGSKYIDPAELDKISSFLTKLGDTLGSFFGGFIGGLGGSMIESFTVKLPAAGENLSSFVDSISKFLELTFPEGFEDTISSLTNMIVSLGTPLVMSSIERLVDGKENIKVLEQFFSSYAKAIVSFSEEVSGNIDTDAVQAASNAGLMLASLYDSLPKQGSTVFKWFSGEKSLSTFAKEIKDFAIGIKGISTELSDGFDSKSVETASNLGLMLSGLLDGLPKSGSIVSKWFSGEKSLSTFGTQIVDFARSLVEISTIITEGNIDITSIETARNAGLIMNELANAIPESESFKSMLFGGEKDISVFGAQMVLFTSFLIELSNNLSEVTIDLTTIETAKNAGLVLSELANMIPESGGIFEKNQDLGAFGAQLSLFGEGLNNLINSLTGIDQSQIQNVTSIITNIIDFDALREQLMASIDNQSVPMREKLFSVIEEIATECQTKLSSVMDELARTIDEKSSVFEESGRNTIRGLINGLSDSGLLETLYKKGADMAAQVNAGYSDNLEIHSPSKVMERQGRFTILGLIKGLSDTSELEETAYNTGSVVLDAISNAIQLADKILDDGMNPVITPVLDLSNIEENAGGISNLLSAEASLYSAQNINSLLSSLDRRNNRLVKEDEFGIQNGGENGVTFVQNNYSPKSLSSIEIYRQTKNQISVMKGLVNSR